MRSRRPFSTGVRAHWQAPAPRVERAKNPRMAGFTYFHPVRSLEPLGQAALELEEPLRSAPLRSGSARPVALRSAPRRFGSARPTVPRSATLRLSPSGTEAGQAQRTAPPRSAPAQPAALRSGPLRLRPPHGAPLRHAPAAKNGFRGTCCSQQRSLLVHSDLFSHHCS